MHRRHLLRAAPAAALGTAAGCLSAAIEPVHLGGPVEELDAGGMEKHLIFREDGDDHTIVTINQRERPPTLTDRIAFRLHVWHTRGVSVDDISYRLRAPAHSTGTPAEIALHVPTGGPWPPFELRTEDDFWTVISVDDLGRLGEGSVGLDLVVDPVDEPAETLGTSVEIELGGDGAFAERYRASATTEFDILTAED